MEIKADPGGKALSRRGLVGEREESEVKPQFNRKGSRRHIMGPTESRKEVVERLFIGQVDG